MKGDFTRDTFRKEKHYSSVRQQQGRVQLDADSNEQVDIDAYLRETSLGDLIGRCGAPRTGGGFKVGVAGDEKDLTLSAGRLYVDGILCELGPPNAIYTQHHVHFDPKLSAGLAPDRAQAKKSYFVYADVWQRHLTGLEDPLIRETALGGPDTATRTQAFWRIRLCEVDAGLHCLSSPQAWLDATAAPTGRLKARTQPGEPSRDPCIVPADAGYTRLENQLYRVEVHQGGSLGAGATFKWSRDNGSVVSEWLELDNTDVKKPKLKVRSAGRDSVLRLAPGQWVELTDDVHEIGNQPGRLARLLDVQENVLVLDLTAGPELRFTDFPVNPKVRRWDSNGETAIAQPTENDGWLKLEGSIEVRFEAGTYHTGDYWLIPARAFIGEFAGAIEWPRDSGSNPIVQPPHGVVHHYCKLAVVDFDADTGKFSNPRDCRLLFPAVTELIHLFHVGGDGQEALPGETLSCPLEVGVINGQWPVSGARVEFKVSPGGGTVDVPSPGIVTTGPDGIARCQWTLPSGPTSGKPSCLAVTATLRDVAGNPVSIPVVFHARLSVASQVAYNSGECTHLNKATTVQEALDILCRNVFLSYVGGDGQEGSPGMGLLEPLEVRVANGQSPQPGAKVHFTIIQDFEAGSLQPDQESPGARELIVKTDSEGLALCFWYLDEGPPSQRVEAALLDANDKPIPGQVIHFNASIRTRELEPGIRIDSLVITSDRTPLDNDAKVTASRFSQGFRAVCNREIADYFETESTEPRAPAKPNVMVILYIPLLIGEYKPGSDDPTVGFQPLLLGGFTYVDRGNEIVWQGFKRTEGWLKYYFFQEFIRADRVLVQIILKGHFLWSRTDPDLFLDGEAFGRPTGLPPPQPGAQIGLRLPSGDGRRGGDFETWFWLTHDFNLSVIVIEGNTIKGEVNGVNRNTNVLVSLSARGGPVLANLGTPAYTEFFFERVSPGAYTITAILQPNGTTQRKDVEVRSPSTPSFAGPVRAGAPVPEEVERPDVAPSEHRLTDIPGVGRKTGAKLQEKGVTEPAQIAAMTPEELVEIGVSAKQAKEIIENAKRLLKEQSEKPDDQ